eukprot:CFRG6791T1
MPVLLGWSILIFGHLNYVFFISGVITSGVRTRALLLILHAVLGGMVYWCYVKTMITSPGIPSDEFIVGSQYHLVNQRYEFVALAGSLVYPPHHPSHTREENGGLRYCITCNTLKPDRTHHCSTCRTCVLRMDHHCPWIANCVGFKNHKFFYLFLTYGSLLAVLYFASTIGSFVRFIDATMHRDEGVDPAAAAGGSPGLVVSQFILSCVFVMGCGLMSLMHLFLILRNGTTHEHHRLPKFIVPTVKRNGFDLGCRKNWDMIMGSDPYFWFVPIATTRFDGLSFPISSPSCTSDLESGGLLMNDEYNNETGDSGFG